MSLNAPGGTPKKDSIFSSIAPAPAPMPAPAPAPRPAADAEGVSALKAKMDTLERNIVALLDKKLGEQAKAVHPVPPPPPPPARSAESEALSRKIEDLERRLADFSHTASLSASQLKNIEESKIGARREIEDLLKAVREQQKYSEMDRQMHEQLEKAWTRAEELEKKLMEFYSSVLALEAKRRDESGQAADKTAAAIEALTARLAGIEGKMSAQPAAAAELEATVREMSASARESAASFRTFMEDSVRAEMKVLREKIAGETDAIAGETKKFLSEQAALSAQMAAEITELGKSNNLKFTAVETSLEVSARRQALALEEFARRLEADLRNINTDYASSVKKESDERFDKFGAKYADALLSVTFVEGFRAAMGGALDKLESSQAQLRDLLKDVPPDQLERLMGVSGMLVRKKFEAMGSALEALKADGQKLREIKREVEERFKDIFGSR